LLLSVDLLGDPGVQDDVVVGKLAETSVPALWASIDQMEVENKGLSSRKLRWQRKRGSPNVNSGGIDGFVHELELLDA
jgi:hypothetical protein